MSTNLFKNEIEKRKNILNNIDDRVYEEMYKISKILTKSILEGGKVLSAGNGGSAANAQHITGDIVGRYKIERRAYSGITLTVEPSVITAISNDYSYEDLFAREIEGLGKRGDSLILLSSSANSENLVRAAKKAKELGITIIGLLGNNGGKLKNYVDYMISIPESASDLSEEFSMTMAHIILMEVEKELVEKYKGEF